MLNQLFDLDRQEKQAVAACAALLKLQQDPCVRRLETCVRKCFCERCVVKNLVFIEMLTRYEQARQCSDDVSLAALDDIVARFSRVCSSSNGNTTSGISGIKSGSAMPRQLCHAGCGYKSGKEATVCLETQESDAQFDQWRLPRKLLPRGTLPRCAQSVSFVGDATQLDQFYNETSYFFSPLF